METDTIAAIASGLTQSGIGVIRISGAEAVTVGDRVFRGKGKTLKDTPSHSVLYGFAYDDDEKLDEVLVLLMRAPHSFTSEDVVEIQCHGGPWIMKRILEAVIRHGARPAEPGEFTKRAFLGGRIDLSQAEAVMGMVSAGNQAAKDAALSQLHGDLSRKIRDLRAKILEETARIEASLDDPEHLSLEGYGPHLESVLTSLLAELETAIRSADQGRLITEGIRTVILGRPNAGKSSLLNQLIGEERAIVTEVPGTTRDTLEEAISLGGLTLKLIDTAGIRQTQDRVEMMGVARARAQAESADLILYVVDSSQPLDENDRLIFSLLRDHRSIVLLNKCDLEPVISPEEIERGTGQRGLWISAREGIGMDVLRETIMSLFDLGQIRFNEESVITNVRHKTALMDARDSLLLVQQSLRAGLPEDFYTIDLMSAYEALGRIIGESVDDDLVDQIFSQFCLGK